MHDFISSVEGFARDSVAQKGIDACTIPLLFFILEPCAPFTLVMGLSMPDVVYDWYIAYSHNVCLETD